MVHDRDVESYRRDGVLCLRSVIDSDSARRMLAESIDMMSTAAHPYSATLGASTRMGDIKTVDTEPGRFFNAVYLSETNAAFKEFAMHSPLAEHAAALMKSRVARFFYDQLFIKEPGTLSPTRWHNDMPFWPLTGADLISCWVALTPATIASSGVEYVAGSHRWNTRFQPTADHLRDDALVPAPDFSDPANRPGHRFLSWDMQPGDVLFHHPLTVHGAGGNRTQAQRRVGLSVRYIGDDAQWTPRVKCMQLPRSPCVEPGAYPVDDNAFPIAWQAK
jgi:ectoine hydroxylase-related dioxygenase (phytanoyl-CoA dioxygenase family)